MKAAESLGFFCIGEEDFPYRKLIINTIIEKENEVICFVDFLSIPAYSSFLAPSLLY